MDFKIKDIFLILCIVSTANAQLRCYSCSYTSTDSDQSCLNPTESTPSPVCYMNYCTIVRQEFIDPAGQIASFLRACTNNPTYMNTVVEDTYFKSYYRSCTTDLCNTGDGLQSLSGGVLIQYPLSGGPNLLVPGTSSSAHSNVKKKPLYLILGAMTFFIYNILLNDRLQ